jgi:hypothetical protein
MDRRAKRWCACGLELRELHYLTLARRGSRAWASGLADIANYHAGTGSRHDVLDRWGRRVQCGMCSAPAPSRDGAARFL